MANSKNSDAGQGFAYRLSRPLFIENDVVVCIRVAIQCGVYLWDGLRIDDKMFSTFPKLKGTPAEGGV